MTGTAVGEPAGPLAGVRVLEVSRARPGRIAGMLLADLGADVVRAVDPAAPPEPVSSEALCWDRGKRLLPLPDPDVDRACDGADVVLVDLPPAALTGARWRAADLQAGRPGVVHVWLPPYGEHGEWAELPEDPLLLAALSGWAVLYPADDDSPIAPVVAGLTHVQGAMGAAAAVAGLLGRQRSGTAQPAVVTGLHAAAALVGTSFSEIDDAPAFSPSRSLTGTPNWRVYRCADDRDIFLAALTPELFFRALEALDRLEVMALPEVEGDFQAVLDLSRGRAAVTADLEPVFAAQPSGYWLSRLRAHRVPCTTVETRRDWIAGPVVRDNQLRIDLVHDQLGPVTMPDVPLLLSATPGSVRGFAQASTEGRPPWPERRAQADVPAPGAAAADQGTASPPRSLPLDGVTVVDASSFFAGPFVSALLADFGADVVRVEPPAGDSYRFASLAFLAVNQRKRGVVLDFTAADGVPSLHDLLNHADVFVDNLRPRALADLDLGGDDAPRFRQLVHCSVSAFGQAAAFADLPGFDPIFQSISGMAVAQGGADRPIVGGAPLNDVITGALGALGCLAALYRRPALGRGQRVRVSLAASATFAQSAEFTSWPGSPEPPRGALLFRGPDAGHRYHECGDGWVVVAAVDDATRTRMVAALEVAGLADVGSALSRCTVAEAAALLNDAGVPAARVVLRKLPLRDPFLVANGFTHLVPVPGTGTARVVDHHSHWPLAPEPRPGRWFEVGADTASLRPGPGAGEA
jgi:crotonobetainyl-CoA:carnitine CoA-transferase CaiB-like acyl-CoA transferase